jgi:hypothetical protein
MQELPNAKRVADDAPNRCQGITRNGQCPSAAMENTIYCVAHGGSQQQAAQRRQSLQNYRLTQWHAKVLEKANSTGVKSLREEVGILRIMLEERLNMCKDATDLLLMSGPISDLVMKIDTVVKSCHKLEFNMGMLLDKQQLLNFANAIITIITETVEDEALVSLIADRILGELSDTRLLENNDASTD